MSDLLGAFEQTVLLAILRLGDEAYGRAVWKEVRERTERNVAAGAVQATLERLERQKAISSRLGRGTPIRGGRPKRFYHVETKGLCALNDARVAAERLWKGLAWPLKGYA